MLHKNLSGAFEAYRSSQVQNILLFNDITYITCIRALVYNKYFHLYILIGFSYLCCKNRRDANIVDYKKIYTRLFKIKDSPSSWHSVVICINYKRTSRFYIHILYFCIHSSFVLYLFYFAHAIYELQIINMYICARIYTLILLLRVCKKKDVNII